MKSILTTMLCASFAASAWAQTPAEKAAAEAEVRCDKYSRTINVVDMGNVMAEIAAAKSKCKQGSAMKHKQESETACRKAESRIPGRYAPCMAGYGYKDAK